MIFDLIDKIVFHINKARYNRAVWRSRNTDFENIALRLKAVYDSDSGAYFLITADTNEDHYHINAGGLNDGVLNGIVEGMENALSALDDVGARQFADLIKDALIRDEQQRFNERDINSETVQEEGNDD